LFALIDLGAIDVNGGCTPSNVEKNKIRGTGSFP